MFQIVVCDDAVEHTRVVSFKRIAFWIDWVRRKKKSLCVGKITEEEGFFWEGALREKL